jgi:hypothetical protein
VDLTSLLLRAGASRPHVLVASMPGAAQVRLAAEELLRGRGWATAMAPADADILLVAGTPAEDISPAVAAAWAAVPAPRSRATAASAGQVTPALDAARAELASVAEQRNGAPRGDLIVPGGEASGGHQRDDAGGMEMPGGLPMAGRGADRDGLALDVLHVPLGPLLPDWPAGLLVRVTLQGDVVQRAEAGFLGLTGDGGSFWNEPWRRAAAGEPVSIGLAARRRAAARLDSLGRFLAVAGWDDAASAARRLRDEVLSGAPASPAAALRRLAGRVTRSRVLAWSTRDLGVLPADRAAGPAARAAGDVTARYRRWCADLVELARLFDDASPLAGSALDPPRDRGTRPASAAVLALLPGLLEGVELAAARLIVASLDPDPDELAAPVPAAHGHGG